MQIAEHLNSSQTAPSALVILNTKTQNFMCFKQSSGCRCQHTPLGYMYNLSKHYIQKDMLSCKSFTSCIQAFRILHERFSQVPS